MSTHPRKEYYDLGDLHSESGRQSETIDLSNSHGPVLTQLKTMQMAIPPFSKELVISFDDKGRISNIVFMTDQP